MLAPGDYLTTSVPAAPAPSPPTDHHVETTPATPAQPVSLPDETEPRSFLLTLLRALGAIHT
jgi:hypothetical protein